MKSGYDQFFNQVKKHSTNSKRAKAKKAVQSEKVRAKFEQPTDAELEIRKALGLKQAKKQRKGSVNMFILAGLASILAIAWLAIEPWRLDQLMEFVEIGVFSDVHAEDSGSTQPEKSSSKQAGKGAKSSSEKSRALNSINEAVTKDFSYYTKLNEKRKELDLREKELNELEGELHKQRREVEAQIQHLEKLRQQIAGVLKDKVEIDQEKVKRLVGFYSNMKSQQAAKIIGTLNEDLAIEVLGQMKKKNAAAIMNLLDPGKAQVLSEKFTGYKRR